MRSPSHCEATPARRLASARRPATLAVAGSQTGSRDGYIEQERLFCKIVWGAISPVLANRALDGLQRLLAERFMSTPGRQRKHKVHLVRYADDFIITGTSKVLLEYEVKPLVEHFLAERGLELSHEK